MEQELANQIELSRQKHWGKYRGLVVDRNDPEQLGRLKVRVPSLLGDAETGWAFPVAPYAGKDLGFFFIPQVGDLVWVEFAEGELEYPLWSGCGWAKPGGQTEIPQEAQQSYPDQQVLKTKSGIVIIVNDVQGSQTITIRAQTGCEIVMDPNANKITVQANEVIIRGAAGATQELATKAFVQQVFDMHTHASGVGPTATPVPTSGTIPFTLTSVLKAE